MVGWDPSALIPAINGAIDAGIPVVCVDADVPNSKRYSFIGTDWFDLGVRQAEAMAEILDVSDRIYVMREGTISGELSRHDATEEAVMRLASLTPH